MFLIVFQETTEFWNGGIIRVIWGERMKRQFEKTMECRSTHIDGGNAGWRKHHMLFLCLLTYIFQKGRLPCPCLPCKEEGVVCKLDDVKGIFQLWVVEIDSQVFESIPLSFLQKEATNYLKVTKRIPPPPVFPQVVAPRHLTRRYHWRCPVVVSVVLWYQVSVVVLAAQSVLPAEVTGRRNSFPDPD